MQPLPQIPLLFATFLTFCVLYAPQPLQPLLAEIYQLNLDQAGLITAVMFIPLSLAPLIYGYILTGVSAKKLLVIHLVLLSVLQLAFIHAVTFNQLLIVRLLEGVCIPAILTSVMTLFGNQSGANKTKQLAYYVAVTIAGGAFGRISAALYSAFFNWSDYFLILSLLLLACAIYLATRTIEHATANMGTIKLADFRALISNRFESSIFLIIFCLFFSFSAFYNFLPFRLATFNTDSPEMIIALSYIGYFIGIITAVKAHDLYQRLGKSIVFGGSVLAMMLGLLLAMVPNATVIFIVSFVICSGMFLVHGLSGGLLNQHSQQPKSLVNGAYVCSYYLGGLLGAYLPGLLLVYYNWYVFILALVAVLLIAACMVNKITVE